MKTQRPQLASATGRPRAWLIGLTALGVLSLGIVSGIAQPPTPPAPPRPADAPADADPAPPSPPPVAPVAPADTPAVDAPAVGDVRQVLYTGRLIGVDRQSIEVSIDSDGKDERVKFVIPEASKLELNGEAAELDQLRPGDAVKVSVTPTRPGVAMSVVAARPVRGSDPSSVVIGAGVDTTKNRGSGTAGLRNRAANLAWAGLTVAPTQERALRILEIAQNGPAAQAGVQASDLVVTVEGRQNFGNLSGPADLANVVPNAKPGMQVNTGLLRNGQRVNTTIELAAMPSNLDQGVNAATNTTGVPGTTGVAGAGVPGVVGGVVPGTNFPLGVGGGIPGAGGGGGLQGAYLVLTPPGAFLQAGSTIQFVPSQNQNAQNTLNNQTTTNQPNTAAGAPGGRTGIRETGVLQQTSGQAEAGPNAAVQNANAQNTGENIAGQNATGQNLGGQNIAGQNLGGQFGGRIVLQMRQGSQPNQFLIEIPEGLVVQPGNALIFVSQQNLNDQNPGTGTQQQPPQQQPGTPPGTGNLPGIPGGQQPGQVSPNPPTPPNDGIPTVPALRGGNQGTGTQGAGGRQGGAGTPAPGGTQGGQGTGTGGAGGARNP